MEEKKTKERMSKVIMSGIIISVVSGVIVAYFELYMKTNWFHEEKPPVQQEKPVGRTATATPTPEDIPGPTDASACPIKDGTAPIPLKVLEYSSQRNASQAALAAVDGDYRTAWVSGSSPPSPQYLVLSTADETLCDISAVQLCTASAKSPQAAMAIRAVTLLSSLDVNRSRTLATLGTYTFPPGQTCQCFQFPAPITLRVLALQINENAGDAAVLVSEVTAYGSKHKQP